MVCMHHERHRGPLRLLLIDDSEDDALLVAQELRRCRYDVAWERVDSRKTMAEALDREAWDLIVSDFAMPGFSGPEALALYRERGLDIPFIIVSGTVREEDAVEALLAGAHDFITKGRVARLGPAVGRALRDAEERASRRRIEAAHAESARKLRESEARYRQVIEGIQDAIVAGRFDVLDPTAAPLALASPQVETLTGRTAADFLADPHLWWHLVHPDDRLGRHDAAMQAFHTRSSVRRRYRMWNEKQGQHRWIEDTFTPELDDLGRPVGFFGVARDVTEQRRIEEQLAQAQKMAALGQLAGGIAHDFNNLLGVILGYSELVVRQLAPDHPAHARAREIQSVVERAAALPRQLLAFGRKQSAVPTVLDLNSVVSDTERMLRRVIGEAVQLVTTFREDVCFIRADAGHVSQVVVNLAINARDAMPAGGRLSIETSALELVSSDARWPEAAPGRYVTLAVADNGCGMDAATRARVFDPFFTTKEPGKGTGLGLTNVRSIVTLHGGHVHVDSAPGKGTTFTIVFPRAALESQAAETVEAPSAAGGSERILILEDEAALRMIVRELLEDSGYSVAEAEMPEAALSAAERDPDLDLLVTDVVLPRMGGRQVADAIRATHPRLKVLFVSGYAGEDAVVLGSGDEHFLQKPFAAEALLAKIREVLDDGRH
jgi:PAS domain S-box-containing protein